MFATGVPPEDGEYELSMPFVLCTSEGGPYDDAAFVAGATIGLLLGEFEAHGTSLSPPPARYINAKYLPQVDLVAMKYGYKMEVGEMDEDSGWQLVSFI